MNSRLNKITRTVALVIIGLGLANGCGKKQQGEWDSVAGHSRSGPMDARKDAIGQLDNKYSKYDILEETPGSTGGEVTARDFAGTPTDRSVKIYTCTIRVQNAVRR